MDMRTIRGLVAALLAGLGAVAFAPLPAYACSCAMSTPARYAQEADAVFTGTVEDKHGPEPAQIMSSGDPVTYVVRVDRAYEGEVAPITEVLSAASGASCGLENIKVGQRYVVFATFHNVMGDPTEELWASLCGGTTPADAGLVGAVEAVAGPGVVVPATDPPTPDPADQDPAAEAPPDGSGGPADLATPVALASGGALVVLTGLLWLRLLRR